MVQKQYTSQTLITRTIRSILLLQSGQTIQTELMGIRLHRFKFAIKDTLVTKIDLKKMEQIDFFKPTWLNAATKQYNVTSTATLLLSVDEKHPMGS